MRATATTLIVLILLAMGYVLSHAPVYYYTERHAHTPFYEPVEWLIDNRTFCREPLLRWADVWGVRVMIELDSDIRDLPATHS